MCDLVWSKKAFTNGKLGAFCESYARMALASYGLSIYVPEVDDHGIDFLAETEDGRFLKFQVKSIRTGRGGYVFVKERYFPVNDDDFYLFLILLEDGKRPESFLIPTSAWQDGPGNVFVYHGEYKEPEYGVNISKRNMPKFEKFRLEDTIHTIIPS